jgi:hypothetical protein
LVATFLTVSATPPLPLLLAVAGVARRAVLRVVVLRFAPVVVLRFFPVVVLRFAPLLDAREALADRVVRLLPLRADAGFARAGFLVPEPFRLDALAELLVRVLPLCGVVPAMSNPLVSAIDRCVRGTHSAPQ